MGRVRGRKRPAPPRRVAAGVAYALGEMANEGHVYVPQGELLATATKMLEVPVDLVQEGVETLEQEEEVYRETIEYPMAGAQAGREIREEEAGPPRSRR